MKDLTPFLVGAAAAGVGVMILGNLLFPRVLPKPFLTTSSYEGHSYVVISREAGTWDNTAPFHHNPDCPCYRTPEKP